MTLQTVFIRFCTVFLERTISFNPGPPRQLRYEVEQPGAPDEVPTRADVVFIGVILRVTSEYSSVVFTTGERYTLLYLELYEVLDVFMAFVTWAHVFELHHLLLIIQKLLSLIGNIFKCEAKSFAQMPEIFEELQVEVGHQLDLDFVICSLYVQLLDLPFHQDRVAHAVIVLILIGFPENIYYLLLFYFFLLFQLNLYYSQCLLIQLPFRNLFTACLQNIEGFTPAFVSGNVGILVVFEEVDNINHGKY